MDTIPNLSEACHPVRNRRNLLIVLLALLAFLLLACSLGGKSAQLAPTPTKTPRPSFTPTFTPTNTETPTYTPTNTATPLPPTDTPGPTNTPVILTATPSPTAGTGEPGETDVAPTDTAPVPSDTPVPPTNTSAPAATNTPVPPTAPPQPQVDFRIKDLYAFEDGSLAASGLHNVYFTVEDASGAPIDGVIIEELNNQPPEQVISGDKGPGKSEYTMWASDYRFRVTGDVWGQSLTSEETHDLSIVFGHAECDD